MPASPFDAALLSVSVDSTLDAPYYLQLFEQLRTLILSERVAPGQRLPSSRTLAEELGVSRTTTLAAYDQLQSEGYIEPRRGAGIFVSNVPPDKLLVVRTETLEPPRGTAISSGSMAAKPVPFTPGLIDVAGFPAAQWARTLSRSWRHSDPEVLQGADPRGLYRLRAAIAEHLRIWRGLKCTPEEVLITSGSAEALDILYWALLSEGDEIWLEDPGYANFLKLARTHRLAPAFIPVDQSGMDIAYALHAAPAAKAAVVTPSQQYPLGVSLPLTRRIELLNWAATGKRWIIEDDYDSEFRYAGHPLAALMSLDESDRVIYMGSFSKVLFPTLRLGYVVAPPSLVPTLTEALIERGPKATTIAQAGLADWITSGAFAAHIRRMRRTYARRLDALLAALQSHCATLLTTRTVSAGMQFPVWLSDDLADAIGDVEASRLAAQHGIAAPALSHYTQQHFQRPALMLGFTGFDETTLRRSAARLASALTTR